MTHHNRKTKIALFSILLYHLLKCIDINVTLCRYNLLYNYYTVVIYVYFYGKYIGMWNLDQN